MKKFLYVFAIVPNLVYPFIIYILIALFNQGGQIFDETFPKLPLFSGAEFALSIGDFIIVLGVIFLSLEIIKSTRFKNVAFIDHTLSIGLFIVCLIMFMGVKLAGTSTFFILMLMTLVDVITSVIIGIAVARRDFGGGGVMIGGE